MTVKARLPLIGVNTFLPKEHVDETATMIDEVLAA